MGVPEFFPLTAVTDPKFVLFKHVLCFPRIMSTLCPNSCRQTARIGGGATAPPAPCPVRLCFWPSISTRQDKINPKIYYVRSLGCTTGIIILTRSSKFNSPRFPSCSSPSLLTPLFYHKLIYHLCAIFLPSEL